MTPAAGLASSFGGPALQARLAPLRARWQSLAPRERRGAAIAATVLALFIVWSAAVRPAWRLVREAPAQIDALELQLQTMQRLAAEARELRAAPPLAAGQSLVALRTATDRLGDKAKLTTQGERAVLTLNGVGSDALRAWLAEVRSAARARPVEAQLTRASNGFSGTIVVAVGGAS